MPNILVKVPQGAFPGDSREQLMRQLHDAAARCEQLPNDPVRRLLCWVMLDEVPGGHWHCGGRDATAALLPCLAVVHLPAGVLDAGARAQYVRQIHAAFEQALPAQDKRRLATSVIVNEVPDGTWAANGTLAFLPDLVRAAGYQHLQALA